MFIKKIRELNRRRLARRKSGRVQEVRQEIISHRPEMAILEGLVKQVEALDPAAAVSLRHVSFAAVPWNEPALWPQHEASALKNILLKVMHRPEHIVVVPWLKHGGADLVACHITDALVSEFGASKVMVLVADYQDVSAEEKLPAGVKPIVVHPFEQTDLRVRVETLTGIIAALRPKAIYNVNSHSAWEMIRRYGKYFSKRTRLNAALFCPDYDDKMRPAGYSTLYFRDCIDVLHTVISDNEDFGRRLASEFCLPPEYREKIRPLRFPVNVRADAQAFYGKESKPRSGRRPCFLWASRITMQKNPATLVKIADAMPEADFHVYGWGGTTDVLEFRQLARDCRNIEFKGEFSNIDEIPMGNFNAFVYTSLFDGLPNILLEIGKKAIPIVSAIVGGIDELVDVNTGWPVKDPLDVEAYVEVLRKVAADPDEAKRRAQNLYEYLNVKHSQKQFLFNFRKKILEST